MDTRGNVPRAARGVFYAYRAHLGKQQVVMMAEQQAANILTDRLAELTCSSCNALIDISQVDPFLAIQCPSCQANLVVPAKLGVFRLTQLLGSGGMGAVYEGIDESLGRPIAVKVMLKSLGDDQASFATFQSEARMAAALNHPNICQIYSFGQEKGQPYIAMEMLSGKRLEEMFGPDRPLDEELSVRIGLDVARGLQAAEAIGLIHSDIKPKNILLDAKGTAKIVDFGLATFADKQAAEPGIWGTPYYIAPENAKRQSVDCRSDIYSLGATLYHVLTGVPPFDGETPVEVVKARLGKPAKPISKLRKDLNRKLANTVMRMIEERPARRHPTYASLIGDLEGVHKDILAQRKGSPSASLQTGKVVLTKKSGFLLKGDSGQLEQDGTGRVVLTKRHKTPLTVKNHPLGKSSKSNALSSFAAAAVVIVLILAMALGFLGFSCIQKRNKQQKLAVLFGQISAKESSMTGPAQALLANARSLRNKHIVTIKTFKDGTIARRHAAAATQHAEAALVKGEVLQDILSQAYQAKTAAQATYDLRTVQNSLSKMTQLEEESQAIAHEIRQLISRSITEMERARNERNASL